MARFGAKTVKQTMEQVGSNDETLTSLDLTKSASFCMKSLDNTVQLCEALKRNTVIKSVCLRECEIVDAGAQAIAEVLEVNHTIEEFDLQLNYITQEGVNAIGEGLKKNKGLRTLNLMNQTMKTFGEGVLEKWLDMLELNTTLVRINWKLESARTSELQKRITRNVEIQRRQATGVDHTDLLPDGLRPGAGGAGAAATAAEPAKPSVAEEDAPAIAAEVPAEA